MIRQDAGRSERVAPVVVVLQADGYIGRIDAIFDVLAMYDIGMQRPELGEDI